MWKRKTLHSPSIAAKRLAKISSLELPSWADQTLFSLNQALSLWGKEREPFQLEEAIHTSKILTEVLEEIQRRNAL